MPGPVVCSGAVLQCSFGVAPSPLTVLAPGRPTVAGMAMANLHDRVPFVNVQPFALCTTTSNPAVAAATAAALGALTPAPCMPALPAPWVGASPTVTVGGSPGLTTTARCQCLYGGVISILAPGPLTVTAS